MNLKILILLLMYASLFVGRVGYAQIYAPTEELEKQYRPPLNQTGSLVSLKVVPATNQVNVYVAGKNPDEFFRTNDVDFRAYILNAKELTPIATNAEGDFFTVAVDPAKHPDIGIEVRYKGDVENFDVNLQPAAPAVQPTRSPEGGE